MTIELIEQSNTTHLNETIHLKMKGSFDFTVVETELADSAFDTYTAVGSRVPTGAPAYSDMIDRQGNITAYEGDLMHLMITPSGTHTGVDVKVEVSYSADDPTLTQIAEYTGITGTSRVMLAKSLDLDKAHTVKISWKYSNPFTATTNELTSLSIFGRIFEAPATLPSYAFAGDTPTAASSGFTNVATSVGSANITAPTGGAIATDAFLVTNYSEVVVRVIPTDTAATWDFQVYQSNVGDNDMDKVRLASDTGQVDRTRFIVNTKGADYLFLAISNISSGDVSVEMVPISPS